MRDDLTAEILRNALCVAAEEASIVVVRSAYSTFIVEGADAAAAILDARGRLVAHSLSTAIIQCASLRSALPYVLRQFLLRPCRPVRCSCSTTSTRAASTPTTCSSSARCSWPGSPRTSPGR